MGATNEEFKGMADDTGNNADRLTVPSIEHESVDASAGDATPSMQNCRYIYADVSGICKISYGDAGGNSKTEVLIVGPTLMAIRNVTKVYQYYVGTTAITSKAYTDAGVSVAGLKLRR